jgi:hypothetical protein
MAPVGTRWGSLFLVLAFGCSPGSGGGAASQGGTSAEPTGGTAGAGISAGASVAGTGGGASGSVGTSGGDGGAVSGGGAQAGGGVPGGTANGGGAGGVTGAGQSGGGGVSSDCSGVQPPASCAVCLAATADTACDGCSKTNCCPALRRFSDAADAAAFNTCAAPCPDRACVEDCVARYPAAGAAYHGAWDCRFDSCGEECVCAADAADVPCDACAKARCCAAFVSYNAAPDLLPFSTCVAPCTTRACADACVESHPMAGAAYNTLSACLTSNCRTECGG